jgi:hypothetical protein
LAELVEKRAERYRLLRNPQPGGAAAAACPTVPWQ